MEMTVANDADDVMCFLRSAGPCEHTPTVLLLHAKQSRASIPTNSSLYRPRSCLEVLPAVPRFRIEVFVHARTVPHVHSFRDTALREKPSCRLPADGEHSSRSHPTVYLLLGQARMGYNYPA